MSDKKSKAEKKPIKEKEVEKVTKEVTKEVTEKITEEVSEEVTKEVTEEVTKEVTEEVSEEKPVSKYRTAYRGNIAIQQGENQVICQYEYKIRRDRTNSVIVLNQMEPSENGEPKIIDTFEFDDIYCILSKNQVLKFIKNAI